MKLTLGRRVFLAVLVAVTAMAVVELAVVRWTLFGSGAESTRGAELARLEDLARSVSAHYRQQRDWTFLPEDSAARKAWLREELGRLPGRQGAHAGTQAAPATLGYRVGLLDSQAHYLAGVIPNRLAIAFASIDTVRRSIVVDGQVIGSLVLARAQDPNDELAVAFLIDQQGKLAWVTVLGVLLAALTAAALAAHVRKPIQHLVEGARRLEEARFDTRLDLRRSDELGEVADAFDHLAARLEDAEHSRRQWVADTSHELRTPLSVLRGQMEAMQDGIRPATPESIALMLRQVLSLTKLVDELHQLARADVGQLEYTRSSHDAWRLVEHAVTEFEEKFRAAALGVSTGAAPLCSVVVCDPDRMHQVLVNLLENCVRHTAAGGRVEVNGSVVGDELRIAIDDSAPGVPAHSLRRLGERFFRVEASRNRALGGAGLGLSLSRQIVHAHGGRLEFEPSPLGGLRATLVLKLAGAG